MISVALVWRGDARRVAARARLGARCCWPSAIPSSCGRTAVRSRTSSRSWSTAPRARTSASGRSRPTRRATSSRQAPRGARRRRAAVRRNLARRIATTEGTQLFAALRGGARRRAARAGRRRDPHHRRRRPRHSRSAAALGFNAPLHALITGHEGERQRRIELVEAPRYGIVGKDQIIARESSTAPTTASRSTSRCAATARRSRRSNAKVGERIDVKAPIEHAGPNVIELEVAPVEGELAADSNRAVVNIEGVRDKLRVLLVSGKPHPGERMWRNLLKSDANVDLVHFTILRPPEKGADGTPINELSLIAFPVADLFGRKIKDFDLIIFDRYAQQSILPYVYLDNIVKYVRDGGALLMAEGPEFATPDGLYYSPLGDISPAEPTATTSRPPYRARRLRRTGERHPVTRGPDRLRRHNGAELGPMVPARSARGRRAA